MTKVAINGFGRIGRAAFKIAVDQPELDVVAINDIVPVENLAYLLKYDTVYGRYPHSVSVEGGDLVVGGKHYRALNEKDPSQLPWAELGVGLVLECSGVFTKEEDLKKHLEAGAKYVLLSAPLSKPTSGEVPTVVHGVNRPDGSVHAISCASCTTNAITPVVEIMGRRIGIVKAIMTTVHAYTASQSLVDSPSRKIRRGRAAGENFVPTSTGAAVATTKVLPQYEGLFDGVAIRGPVPAGSIADIVFVTERDTSPEEINDIFREEAASSRYQGIVGVADDPIVSSDIIGDSRASVIDAEMTQVVDGNLVKIMSWYDNEWGFTSQMIREAVRLAETQSDLKA